MSDEVRKEFYVRVWVTEDAARKYNDVIFEDLFRQTISNAVPTAMEAALAWRKELLDA